MLSRFKFNSMQKHYIFSLIAAASLLCTLPACGEDDPELPGATTANGTTPETPETPSSTWSALTASPDAWDQTRRADVTYQLLVYSFADSNGDGYGDFNGVTAKLDYLQSLGVTALWLSPIHPSPSYHGYDVTDYTTVNPKLGTEADFSRLVTEAHNRGIKIYLDYVMNHTSDQHPWFVAAKSSPDSEYRGYYTFSQNPSADVKAGNLAMFASDMTNGYSAGEWNTTTTAANNIKGVYKFELDWSNSSAPTVTVTKATSAEAENTTSGSDDRYIWYGDSQCKRFYNKGGGKYELTLNIDTDWGFLIRSSNTTWDNGTKYGAPTASTKLELGKAFSLDNKTAANILFSSMDLWYYHCAFSSSMPDLDYGKVGEWSSNATYNAMLSAAKGWVDRGVDGFRLDAVKHIYHNATNTDNPQFLNRFYTDMNTYYKSKGKTDDLYMVGEVLEEYGKVAPYYAGLPALFEFSFWYRLSWAINNQTGCYFAANIMSYQTEYAKYRKSYIEPTKLSNHDEERTGTTLGKNTDKEKLAACVLLTAGGSPYIYYGEELGLYGGQSNGDEYVRGPMLWGDNTVTAYTDKVDKNVANSIKSVTVQQSDSTSLLSVYKRFIQLRHTYPALAQGTMSAHSTYNDSNLSNKPIAAWYMTKDSQKMLVVHNFGATTNTISLTDNVDKAVGVNGSVEQKDKQYRLGAYSTVVFLLK
jgi:glycosidase